MAVLYTKQPRAVALLNLIRATKRVAMHKFICLAALLLFGCGEKEISPEQKAFNKLGEFWKQFPPEAEMQAEKCGQLADVSEEYQKRAYGTPNTSRKQVWDTCMRNAGYGIVVDTPPPQ